MRATPGTEASLVDHADTLTGMTWLHSLTGTFLPAQILLAALLAILFLQSGLDKLLHWKGNLEWLTGHFSKTPLAGQVPILLALLTGLEVAAGAFSAAGVLLLVAGFGSFVAYLGALLSALALLALFFGQRVAKDYPGAASLVPYFLVALLGLFIL